MILSESNINSFINAPCGIENETPLHIAVMSQNRDLIRLLLMNGANPSASTALFDRKSVMYCRNP